MQVAIPEFDGRLITVPFSFKEVRRPDGVPVYVADPERAARVAGIAVRHARLRARAERRASGSRSCCPRYPTKHARVGNAVGLDTPASAVVLLRALRDAGYDRRRASREDGDELIHALIAAGGHDVEWLTEEQLRRGARPGAAGRRTARWFDALPASLRDGDASSTGASRRARCTSTGDGEIVLAALRFGNVVLMIQPPRGFGENPIAIYHDPDLPPSHHYLAAYRWLERRRSARTRSCTWASTARWSGCPARGSGCRPACAPDAVLGDLPLVYPFIVNDPGEGTQAKRRAHAVVVDHLVPPMARAETYGEHGASWSSCSTSTRPCRRSTRRSCPAVRAQIWTLIQAAQLHHDLHVGRHARRRTSSTTSCCTSTATCARSRTSQIRDGLHVLGGAPDRRGAGQPGAGGAARAPGLGRRARAAGAARGAARPYGLDERRCWPSRVAAATRGR